MNDEFLNNLYSKQQQKQQVPSNKVIAKWASCLICILFPELSKCKYPSKEAISEELEKLQKELKRILDKTKACSECDHEKVSREFFKQLPELHRMLNTDIVAIHRGDPAAKNEF